MFKPIIASTAAIALLIGIAATASADEKRHVTYTTDESFEDVIADLEDAIINQGLVVDFTGQLNKMLERTSQAADSVSALGAKSPYVNARFLTFCSSKLTHEAVSANPYNIDVCPHVVFAFEANAEPGKVVVGYRVPALGSSRKSRKVQKKVTDLLDDIVQAAAGK